MSKPLMGIHGLPKVFGGSLPCEIWTRFMTDALSRFPIVDWPPVDLGSADTFSSSPRPRASVLFPGGHHHHNH